MAKLPPQPGFGVYVHIPFCVHRCSYCDFYSSTQYSPDAFHRVATRIAEEIREATRWLKQNRELSLVTSVFLGGGTPSLMPLEDLKHIFDALLESAPLAESAEITLEANPETVSGAFCEGLSAQTPVNRVSLGAQSFQSQHLKTLERLGSAQSITRAVYHLRQAGFENYSLDLIFGIPGQTPEQLIEGIDAAAELQPRHISFYSLTLKQGHRLYSGLPADDEAASLYDRGAERLEAHGYLAYEISNFSLPGFESRHGLLYWSGGDFLGVGPSAASRFFWDGSFFHRRQISHWERYAQGPAFPAPGFENTNAYQTVLEATFLELRKREGIDLEGFHARYGHRFDSCSKLGLFVKEGLLETDGKQLRLSRKGWLLAEGIATGLVNPP